ncbi:MAG TPA: hypothetical protein VHM28_00985 [Anaerolineales bacterium]|jgi:hypothetical protein|nr:hypothetical protein [Anaerolineales bacterium]
MKNRAVSSPFLVAMTVASLMGGFGLRGYWSLGGPDWAYWLSDFLASGYGLFLGSMLMLRGLDLVEGFRKFNNPDVILNRLGKSFFSIIFGMLFFGVGLFTLITTIRFIALGCPTRIPGC